MTAVHVTNAQIIEELGRTYASNQGCTTDEQRDGLIGRLYMETRARTTREAQLEQQIERLRSFLREALESAVDLAGEVE